MLLAQTTRMGLNDFLRENWRIVLPLALGFIGIYILLPRARRMSPAVGGAIAGVGVVLAGLWWTRYEAIWVEQLLFYAFSGLAIVGAGLMLSQSNPVHAALAFALVVLSSCGLFLLLAAPFLMAATIIIYAGAIVVTFLFVIMLAQQAGRSSADIRSREPFLASLAGFVMLGTLVAILDRGYSTAAMDDVVARLERLTVVERWDEVAVVLGEPAKDLDGPRSLVFVGELRETFATLRPKGSDMANEAPAALAPDSLEEAWARRDPAAVKAAAATILEHARAARADRGSLVAVKGTPEALARGPLPARNVAALGRTMFTDYLIPVEMAGILLLAATIGAIVIASRQTEGLR